GDPDAPIRVACRALPEHRLVAFAAAGNEGPQPGSVMSPACEDLPAVIAVGCMTFSPFLIAEYSARGPTKAGLIKPDIVFFGHRLLTASPKSDTAFEIKSGTSFACPACAGVFNLGAELLSRTVGEEIWYGEEAIELCQQYLMRYVGKPEGAPIEKDNVYGFGLPLGTEILKAVLPMIDISAITPILGIGMLGMVMTGMAGAMK
ncbi:unnamed protein product, partial [marine sediment metagenome]